MLAKKTFLMISRIWNNLFLFVIHSPNSWDCSAK